MGRGEFYLGRVRLGNSVIRIHSGIYFGIHSGIYSGYSAPGSRIAAMEIQVFWNENSSQTNAYSHYPNYSYSGLIPNECALRKLEFGTGHGIQAADYKFEIKLNIITRN